MGETTDRHEEMERALMGLMPVALSDKTQTEMEARIDGLAGGEVLGYDFSRWAKWMGGLAAVIAVGFFAMHTGTQEPAPIANKEREGMVVLAETDRVEEVSDAGLFVDAGGSAVRKLRVRVVEESRVRDRETGIELTLKAPRQETYLVPVSTF